MTVGFYSPLLYAAQLKCNIGVADITPNESVLLRVLRHEKVFHYYSPTIKTHCLVIQNDTTRVCIITNDLMEISIDLAKKLRNEIAVQTGIPYNHILSIVPIPIPLHVQVVKALKRADEFNLPQNSVKRLLIML